MPGCTKGDDEQSRIDAEIDAQREINEREALERQARNESDDLEPHEREELEESDSFPEMNPEYPVPGYYCQLCVHDHNPDENDSAFEGIVLSDEQIKEIILFILPSVNITDCTRTDYGYSCVDIEYNETGIPERLPDHVIVNNISYAITYQILHIR